MTREPTASPVLTKWWKSELMLTTNFGSLCPKVTKVGSQNFGYQIWFCTRLLRISKIEGIAEWHLLMATITIFELICYQVHVMQINSKNDVAGWLRKWPKGAIGSTSAARLGTWHVRKSPDNMNISWYRDLSKKKLWNSVCGKYRTSLHLFTEGVPPHHHHHNHHHHQMSNVVPRLGPVPYFPDMSGWTSGPIFSGEVQFFPDIDRGTSGGDFENYAEPTTHVFRCFYCHTHYKNYFKRS